MPSRRGSVSVKLAYVPKSCTVDNFLGTQKEAKKEVAKLLKRHGDKNVNSKNLQAKVYTSQSGEAEIHAIQAKETFIPSPVKQIFDDKKKADRVLEDVQSLFKQLKTELSEVKTELSEVKQEASADKIKFDTKLSAVEQEASAAKQEASAARQETSALKTSVFPLYLRELIVQARYKLHLDVSHERLKDYSPDYWEDFLDGLTDSKLQAAGWSRLSVDLTRRHWGSLQALGNSAAHDFPPATIAEAVLAAAPELQQLLRTLFVAVFEMEPSAAAAAKDDPCARW